MDDLGLLYFSYDVWTKCHCYQWVSRQKMGQRKLSILVVLRRRNSFIFLLKFSRLFFWLLRKYHFLLSQPINGSSQPTVGKTLLKERGLFVDEYWYWICIGALLGYSLLFNILFIAALTFLKRKLPTISPSNLMRFWIGNPLLIVLLLNSISALVDSKAVISDEHSDINAKKQLTSNPEGWCGLCYLCS